MGNNSLVWHQLLIARLVYAKKILFSGEASEIYMFIKNVTIRRRENPPKCGVPTLYAAGIKDLALMFEIL